MTTPSAEPGAWMLALVLMACTSGDDTSTESADSVASSGEDPPAMGETAGSGAAEDPMGELSEAGGEAGTDDSSVGDAEPADAPLGGPTMTFDSYQDARYCEVLVARMDGAGAVADIYNSIAFGDCPQELWEGLDADAIRGDFPDAESVILNGPRYFLMQEIYSEGLSTVPMLHDFGGIRMVLVATVEVDSADGTPYTEASVARSTVWRFKAGERVFELHSPDGETYVMQSFSRIEDEDLAYEELETLGERIVPPDGWTYVTRVLDEDLDVGADGIATVIQDELTNTYQLVE
jgi:hypothetical protein